MNLSIFTLLEWQKDREMEQDWDWKDFSSALLNLHACGSWGWAKQTPGISASSQVSHMGSVALIIWVIIVASQDSYEKGVGTDHQVRIQTQAI